MTDSAFISIIILNWNGKKFLDKCLTSISDTTYQNYEIIVVDNGSSDGSIELLENKFPDVKLIKNNENLGFSKGNNIGIKNSNGSYVLILNNDTEIINKDWLDNIIKIFESDKKIGVVGCKLIYPNGKLQHAGVEINFLKQWVTILIGWGEHPDKIEYNKDRKVDCVSGAAMFIKREVIEKIGLFDEIFSPAYYEDNDFCIRARIAGYKILYASTIAILHHQSATKKQYRSDYMNYITARNSIIFLLLYVPLKYIPIRIIWEIYRMMGVLFLMVKWSSIEYGRSYFEAVLWNIKNLNIIIKKRIKRKKYEAKGV